MRGSVFSSVFGLYLSYMSALSTVHAATPPVTQYKVHFFRGDRAKLADHVWWDLIFHDVNVSIWNALKIHFNLQSVTQTPSFCTTHSRVWNLQWGCCNTVYFTLSLHFGASCLCFPSLFRPEKDKNNMKRDVCCLGSNLSLLLCALLVGLWCPHLFQRCHVFLGCTQPTSSILHT